MIRLEVDWCVAIEIAYKENRVVILNVYTMRINISVVKIKKLHVEYNEAFQILLRIL